jgi:ribosomal protein S18 acetylase RimI-like enzyme/putative sterol carrier protein
MFYFDEILNNERILARQMMQEQKYAVRNYRNDDEERIVRLFNETYRQYAGFVPRTREYWIWNCLKRPDVSPQGILIVEDNSSGALVGYAVVGKLGSIWELCVGANCNKQKVFSIIIESVKKYITKVEADHISLNVPAEDFLARRMLKAMGFVESLPQQLSVHVLNFQALTEAIARSAEDKLKKYKENILFTVESSTFSKKHRFEVEINSGKINMTPIHKPHSILIKTDAETLTSVLLGTLGPAKALITGKLRIRPLQKLLRALHILSLIQSHDSWFYPKADVG